MYQAVVATFWSIRAGDGDVFTVLTVVNSPASVHTFTDLSFCSIAAHIVYPNPSLSDSVVATVYRSSDVSIHYYKLYTELHEPYLKIYRPAL